jgi:hypothetical protein
MAKKDVWAANNLEKTLERRKGQYKSLMSVIDAMDGELKAKIARTLPKLGKSNTPNYDALDRTSDAYDEKVAKRVVDIINKHYDISNKLHPLSKAFKKEGIDETSKKIIENTYSGHKEALLQAVGNPDYMMQLEQLQSENRQNVEQNIRAASGSGYDHKTHGEGLLDYLVKKHGVDKDKVDHATLRRSGQKIIGAHASGQLSKNTIYRLAPKYKQKAKK